MRLLYRKNFHPRDNDLCDHENSHVLFVVFGPIACCVISTRQLMVYSDRRTDRFIASVVSLVAIARYGNVAALLTIASWLCIVSDCSRDAYGYSVRIATAIERGPSCTVTCSMTSSCFNVCCVRVR